MMSEVFIWVFRKQEVSGVKRRVAKVKMEESEGLQRRVVKLMMGLEEWETLILGLQY